MYSDFSTFKKNMLLKMNKNRFSKYLKEIFDNCEKEANMIIKNRVPFYFHFR